ncbi:MAG: SpoIIE family protein phosphatase [Brevinematia bacterium]
MEYVYSFLILVILLFTIFSIYLALRNLVKKSFSRSKYNLSKKFLTTCYNQIIGSKKVEKPEKYILSEFLKLLQKLLEAKFVAHFKESQKKYTLTDSTEPFFPYITGISKLKKLLSERDLKSIISSKHLNAINYDNNRHRIMIISDTSIIEDKEIKKTLKEINSNVIIIIPTYKKVSIDNLFIAFLNYYNLSEEVEVIINFLIDYISLFIQFTANRETLDNLLNHIKSYSFIEELGLGETSYKITIDPKKVEIIFSNAPEEINQEIKRIIEEEKTKGIDLEKLNTRMIKNITLNEEEKLFHIKITPSTMNLEVNINLIKESKIKETEETAKEIVNQLPIPIVLFDPNSGEIKELNSKFQEIFPEANEYSKIEELLNNQKYISPNKVSINEKIFELQKFKIGKTSLEAITFNPIQIVDQKIAMEIYKEIISIRKYMSSVNLYESNVRSRNLEIYVKYQPSDELIEVGGDFFLVKDIDKKTIVGVFDVMGHNLSAGFLAANIKNFLEIELSQGKEIEKVAEDLNKFIFDLNETTSYDIDTYSYATGILCEVNTEKMKLKVISGGHKYGVLLKEDSIKSFQDIIQSSKPFGITLTTKSIVNEISILPQDKVFLFTDGIVEVEKQDTRGRIIDQAKIIDLIVFCRNLSVRETIEEIFSYIKGLKETKIKDDFVILGFKIKE